MKARTEELLYLLLWSADKLMRPTFRNLTDSFESWAYRNGFLRQLQELEARKLIERQAGDAADAIWRLTENGRLVALGGCDPVAEWSRRWDGRWRLVLFDVPQTKAHARASLRRFLKSSRFGYLQNSVWVSPDPLSEITKELSASAEDVESIITLEARTAAGEADAAIVAGAWNFGRINQLYENSLKVLRELPQTKPKDAKSSGQLLRWAQWEKSIWQETASADPFLPDELLPNDYLGKKVWRERVRVLAQAALLTANG
jgi:phenylacetic acid degradation operon negative regulatory protein